MSRARKHFFYGVVNGIILLVIILLTHQTAYTQNSIAGMVFDDKRQPISDIEIELQDEFYRRIQSIRTQGGAFTFSNLRPGNYYVKVISRNSFYKEKIESVRDLGISNGMTSTNRAIGRDSVQIQIYLEPAKRGGQVGENGVVFVQEIPDEAKKLFSDGTSNIEKGNPEKGVSALKKAIEIFPNYYDALLLLGNQYVNQQKYDEAEIVLIKAAEINPKGQGGVEGLGFVKYKLNKYQEAIETLEKAILINAKSEDAYLWLGIVHRMSKSYQAAETALKKGNEIAEKKNPTIHWQLALLYNDTKRYAEAATELTTFLKLQPDSRDKENIKRLIEQLKEKSKVPN